VTLLLFGCLWNWGSPDSSVQPQDTAPDCTDEYCNGLDDDCDGLVDEDPVDAIAAFFDYDRDGFGGEATSACDTTGLVFNGDDCDDADDDIHPDAQEICDDQRQDEDCDGAADDLDDDAEGKTTLHRDQDGDTYGAADVTQEACHHGEDWVHDATDCNDQAASAHPGRDEVCNDGLDNDCDGEPGDCRLFGQYGTAHAQASIFGETTEGWFGNSARGSGLSVDGDVYEDILVANWVDRSAWVISGPLTGVRSVSEVAIPLEPDSGNPYGFGWSIVGLDANADGVGDVAVGQNSYYGGGFEGRVHVFLGPITAARSAKDAFSIQGETNSQAGWDVRGIPDIDGDGGDDVVIGAPRASPGLVLVAGLADGTNIGQGDYLGVLEGESTDGMAGLSVDGADVDGDGVTDVVTTDPYLRRAYITLGPVTGRVQLADAYVFEGSEDMPVASFVHASGDATGDGYNDVLVGASPQQTDVLQEGDGLAGGAWLLAGPITSTPTAWASYSGPHLASNAGSSGELGHDLDSDGEQDVLLGGYQDDTGGVEAGAAYLFYGPVSAGVRELREAEATFIGGLDSEFGFSVSATDLGGDGYADVLVGAPGESTNQTHPGAVFIFSGIGL
jgi:hypothetical protein